MTGSNVAGQLWVLQVGARTCPSRSSFWQTSDLNLHEAGLARQQPVESRRTRRWLRFGFLAVFVSADLNQAKDRARSVARLFLCFIFSLNLFL